MPNFRDTSRETNVFLYVDSRRTPYEYTLPIPLHKLTLRDFKSVLPKTNFMFFFKSADKEFGVIKEQVVNDCQILPSYEGVVVAWLIDKPIASKSGQRRQIRYRVATRPNSSCHSTSSTSHEESLDPSEDHTSDSDGYSLYVEQGTGSYMNYISSSSSGSSDDVPSKALANFENTPSLPPRRNAPRALLPSGQSSRCSQSITGSRGSDGYLVTIELLLATPNLGLHLDAAYENKVIVKSLVENGAADKCRVIHPGDEILAINNIILRDWPRDEAIEVICDRVLASKRIKLDICKQNPRNNGRSPLPGTRFIQPIDLDAWIAHTEAAVLEERREGTIAETRFCGPEEQEVPAPAVDERSQPEAEQNHRRMLLYKIVVAMAMPNSGLELKQRQWVACGFEDAVLGSDIVDWLHVHVTGRGKRALAKEIARKIFKERFLKHPVTKDKFKESSIYRFCYDIYRQRERQMNRTTAPDIFVPSQEAIRTLGATSASRISNNFLIRSCRTISRNLFNFFGAHSSTSNQAVPRKL